LRYALRACRTPAGSRGKTPKPWPKEALFVPITVNRTRCCPSMSLRLLVPSVAGGRRGQVSRSRIPLNSSVRHDRPHEQAGDCRPSHCPGTSRLSGGAAASGPQFDAIDAESVTQGGAVCPDHGEPDLGGGDRIIGRLRRRRVRQRLGRDDDWAVQDGGRRATGSVGERDGRRAGDTQLGRLVKQSTSVGADREHPACRVRDAV